MPNEETEYDELWDREVKVFADVDVRELIEAGKNWRLDWRLGIASDNDLDKE